ncbi:Vacuolar cation-chloride cotransporter 1 [Spathaspora sp. JA1]|nr:Vacuolar cation-chloride cotransporter 1 [Spathaspora sp. JA1]
MTSIGVSSPRYPPNETTQLLLPNRSRNSTSQRTTPRSARATSKPSNNVGDSKSKEKDNKSKGTKNKLGTFEGVFLPTSLNVLSILMFLRFGFIIGQMGILGTMFLLILSYSINILTTMSVSAIATNGTVKGGGAYYMISRSLGPEFGGAIGIIFVIGQILNSSLNVVGFIEPFLVNFGLEGGDMAKLLPTGYMWSVLYSTILLFICTGVAMVGSSLVSKTALFLFIILTISTLSIPISTLFVKPYHPLPSPFEDILYTGLTWKTFTDNLYPKFTSGAAGSVLPSGVPETFRDLFGIFFPATAGILAGASMSGELKTPSKSIPEGTLKGLLITFILYTLVIVSMGSAIPRELLHVDIKVIQTVNLSSIIIILGEFSTSLFSVIMGIVGASSMINAIADDKIIPGLSIFTTSKKSLKDQKRAQIWSIIMTWFIAQIFLFADINQIATFITMAFLMTFIVTNIACFLLKIGSAPNFRPSFKYFSTRTAFTGAVVCFIAMFIVDGISATLVIFCLTFFILMIHYSTPPSKFGDISQLLIYHQVRKYLLRLKLEMSVKYWRPQILLLCDNPRTSWNLIGFCNHLKKGGLYVLGHVVMMNDDTMPESNNSRNNSVFSVNTYKEVRKQKQAWVKLRDMSKVKAFVQIALGPTLPWGVRNVYLGSGLGGMKPNITVLGFYDFIKHGIEMPIIPSTEQVEQGQLPTDTCRKEKKVSIGQWVQIVEDLIILQATVAVAANFSKLKLPKSENNEGSSFWKSMFQSPHVVDKDSKKYIDLYPIQMSSINQLDNGQSVLSTNFDTYTLILQLGWILSTVQEWKLNNFKLRVIVFVESKHEVEDETTRLSKLLSTLRIKAEIKIVCLDDGSLDSYNYMVKGYTKTQSNRQACEKVDNILHDEQWWINLSNARETLVEIEKKKAARKKKIMMKLDSSRNASTASLVNNGVEEFYPLDLNSSPLNSRSPFEQFKNNRRYTLSNLQEQGMALSFNLRSQTAHQFLDYEDPISDSSDEEDTSNSVTNSMLNLSSYSSLDRMTPEQSLTAPPPSSTPQLAPAPQKHYRPTLKDSIDNSSFKSSDQLSIRSSNLRPNFSSLKIPESQINDDEDGDEENAGEDESGDNEGEPRVAKQTIQFVVEEEDEEEEDNQEDHPLELTVPGTRNKEKPVSRKRASSKVRDSPGKSPAIFANDDGIIKQMRTPQFLAEEEDDDVPPLSPMDRSYRASAGPSGSREQFYKARTKQQQPQAQPQTQAPPAPEDKKTITRRELQEEINRLSFDDIPAKGQHIVLNELMKRNSLHGETYVIFSTLPAPTMGTHLDEGESFEYTNNLAVWLDDLPPVMLLNSQTVTVTTAL